MVKAIRVYELGGPEVLKWEDVELGELKEGEIRVKNKAIGLNIIDTYITPGMEAVGEVIAVGPGLTGRKVGDVVAYAGNHMGSFISAIAAFMLLIFTMIQAFFAVCPYAKSTRNHN